jgi:diguanylate cyclase (GGDEF)-like protein
VPQTDVGATTVKFDNAQGAINRTMQQLSRGWIFALALVGVVLIGVPDYLVGSDVSLAVFYLGPVAVATWYAGKETGALIALISCLAALSDDFAGGHFQVRPGVLAWNGLLNLGFMLVVAYLLAAVHRHMAFAEKLARSDSVTGLFNRRAFLENLQFHLSLAAREEKPITLAYLDLDDFKRINDRGGHEAGDKVLKSIAATLRESTRRTDMVARLGGDEFALLIVGADQVSAVGVIAKVRHALLKLAAREHVTCSIGCVTFNPPPPNASAALRAADSLMYEVKHRGKNAVAFGVFDDRAHQTDQTPAQPVQTTLPPVRMGTE